MMGIMVTTERSWQRGRCFLRHQIIVVQLEMEKERA